MPNYHRVIIEVLQPLIGRDIFDAFGISVTQTQNPIEGILINNIETQCPFNIRIAKQFPNLISRIGISEKQIVKQKFHKQPQPKHKKIDKHLLRYKIGSPLKLDNHSKKNK